MEKEHLYEISKDKADHEIFRACLPVLKKKALRGRNRYAMIEDGYLYCTDSLRIHKGKLQGIYDNGFYEPIKNTKGLVIIKSVNESINYPDTSFIFNQPDHKTIVNDEKFGDTNFAKMLAIIIRNLPEKFTINPDFIKAVKGTFSVKIHPKKLAPVLFESELVNIAIMPIIFEY